jgi:hypothetical protein
VFNHFFFVSTSFEMPIACSCTVPIAKSTYTTDWSKMCPQYDGFQDVMVLQHLCAKVRGYGGEVYIVDDKDAMEERLRKDLRTTKRR